MGTLSDLFNFGRSLNYKGEIPEIFTFNISTNDFIEQDLKATYQKILTDVLERCEGLDDKAKKALWDNCLGSESQLGLLSLVVDAMFHQTDLYLVYKQEVLRIASHEEKIIIKSDYEKMGKSSTGFYFTFRTFKKNNLMKIYSSMEHSVLSSLYKSMNLAKAVQIKCNGLRESVANRDSDVIIDQAVSIATGLSKGYDVLLDAKDSLETSKPEMESVQKAIEFINGKKAFILGFPVSYINGELTTGIGSTGENDSKAIERGLMSYYFSIIKPLIETIFGNMIKYKSQDFRLIGNGLEALKTFELVDERLLSIEDKKTIIKNLFNLGE
jgi:hypothetical protein